MARKLVLSAIAFLGGSSVVLLTSAWQFTSEPYPEFTLLLRKSVDTESHGKQISLERITRRGDGAEAHDIIPVDHYPGSPGRYIIDRRGREMITVLPQLGTRTTWVVKEQPSFRRRWHSDCSNAFGQYLSRRPGGEVLGFRTVVFEFDARSPANASHTQYTLTAAPDLDCAVVGESSQEFDASGRLLRTIKAEAQALSNKADAALYVVDPVLSEASPSELDRRYHASGGEGCSECQATTLGRLDQIYRDRKPVR